jgi:hypothetical protein
MALDELRRQREEKKRLENEKKRKTADAKKQRQEKEKKPKEINTESVRTTNPSIQGQIGQVSISFTQNLLNLILQKIWSLDNYQNPALDLAILELFKKNANDFKIDFDTRKLFTQIHEQVFFVLNSGSRIPYLKFRQTWQQHCGPGLDIDFNPKRKEFIQLLTNRFKPHWVDNDGNPLSEGAFQMLYRIEREPKAIERLFEYLHDHLLDLVKDTEFQDFLMRQRRIIAKLIKEDLLNLLNISKDISLEPIKKPVKSTEHPLKDEKSKMQDNDEDLDENSDNLDTKDE